ncbi:hypothetical protein Cadr_000019926 [Camelus dromedarius]|uniref:Uncharacterized protein n=1 Tax=Camelus dromedarius TaxID=9838 RepID=A0A5N4D1F9_CAMDR|nr:hypothetical protein Cadr_000019926 [Camelus dromedarius]
MSRRHCCCPAVMVRLLITSCHQGAPVPCWWPRARSQEVSGSSLAGSARHLLEPLKQASVTLHYSSTFWSGKAWARQEHRDTQPREPLGWGTGLSAEGPLQDQPPTPPHQLLPGRSRYFLCLQKRQKWKVARGVTRRRIDSCCHGDDGDMVTVTLPTSRSEAGRLDAWAMGCHVTRQRRGRPHAAKLSGLAPSLSQASALPAPGQVMDRHRSHRESAQIPEPQACPEPPWTRPWLIHSHVAPGVPGWLPRVGAALQGQPAGRAMHGLSLGGTWRRTQAWQGLGSVLSPQAGPWLSQAPAAASPRLQTLYPLASPLFRCRLLSCLMPLSRGRGNGVDRAQSFPHVPTRSKDVSGQGHQAGRPPGPPGAGRPGPELEGVVDPYPRAATLQGLGRCCWSPPPHVPRGSLHQQCWLTTDLPTCALINRPSGCQLPWGQFLGQQLALNHETQTGTNPLGEDEPPDDQAFAVRASTGPLTRLPSCQRRGPRGQHPGNRHRPATQAPTPAPAPTPGPCMWGRLHGCPLLVGGTQHSSEKTWRGLGPQRESFMARLDGVLKAWASLLLRTRGSGSSPSQVLTDPTSPTSPPEPRTPSLLPSRIPRNQARDPGVTSHTLLGPRTPMKHGHRLSHLSCCSKAAKTGRSRQHAAESPLTKARSRPTKCPRSSGRASPSHQASESKGPEKGPPPNTPAPLVGSTKVRRCPKKTGVKTDTAQGRPGEQGLLRPWALVTAWTPLPCAMGNQHGSRCVALIKASKRPLSGGFSSHRRVLLPRSDITSGSPARCGQPCLMREGPWCGPTTSRPRRALGPTRRAPGHQLRPTSAKRGRLHVCDIARRDGPTPPRSTPAMGKEPEEAAQSHGASPQGGTGLPAPAPRSGSQVEGAGPHLNLVTPWPNPARFQVQGSHLLLMAAPSREPWPLPWVPVHVWQGLSAGRCKLTHARNHKQAGSSKAENTTEQKSRSATGPQPWTDETARARPRAEAGQRLWGGRAQRKWRAQGRPCPSLLLRPHVSPSSLQSLEHSTGPVPSASCTPRRPSPRMSDAGTAPESPAHVRRLYPEPKHIGLRSPSLPGPNSAVALGEELRRGLAAGGCPAGGSAQVSSSLGAPVDGGTAVGGAAQWPHTKNQSNVHRGAPGASTGEQVPILQWLRRWDEGPGSQPVHRLDGEHVCFQPHGQGRACRRRPRRLREERRSSVVGRRDSRTWSVPAGGFSICSFCFDFKVAGEPGKDRALLTTPRMGGWLLHCPPSGQKGPDLETPKSMSEHSRNTPTPHRVPHQATGISGCMSQEDGGRWMHPTLAAPNPQLQRKEQEKQTCSLPDLSNHSDGRSPYPGPRTGLEPRTRMGHPHCPELLASPSTQKTARKASRTWPRKSHPMYTDQRGRTDSMAMPAWGGPRRASRAEGGGRGAKSTVRVEGSEGGEHGRPCTPTKQPIKAQPAPSGVKMTGCLLCEAASRPQDQRQGGHSLSTGSRNKGAAAGLQRGDWAPTSQEETLRRKCLCSGNMGAGLTAVAHVLLRTLSLRKKDAVQGLWETVRRCRRGGGAAVRRGRVSPEAPALHGKEKGGRTGRTGQGSAQRTEREWGGAGVPATACLAIPDPQPPRATLKQLTGRSPAPGPGDSLQADTPRPERPLPRRHSPLEVSGSPLGQQGPPIPSLPPWGRKNKQYSGTADRKGQRKPNSAKQKSESWTSADRGGDCMISSLWTNIPDSVIWESAQPPPPGSGPASGEGERIQTPRATGRVNETKELRIREENVSKESDTVTLVSQEQRPKRTTKPQTLHTPAKGPSRGEQLGRAWKTMAPQRSRWPAGQGSPTQRAHEKRILESGCEPTRSLLSPGGTEGPRGRAPGHHTGGVTPRQGSVSVPRASPCRAESTRSNPRGDGEKGGYEFLSRSTAGVTPGSMNPASRSLKPQSFPPKHLVLPTLFSGPILAPALCPSGAPDVLTTGQGRGLGFWPHAMPTLGMLSSPGPLGTSPNKRRSDRNWESQDSGADTLSPREGSLPPGILSHQRQGRQHLQTDPGPETYSPLSCLRATRRKVDPPTVGVNGTRGPENSPGGSEQDWLQEASSRGRSSQVDGAAASREGPRAWSQLWESKQVLHQMTHEKMPDISRSWRNADVGTPQTGKSSVRPWKSTRTAGRVHTAQKHVVWRGGFQNNHEIREARPTAQHMLHAGWTSGRKHSSGCRAWGTWSGDTEGGHEGRGHGGRGTGRGRQGRSRPGRRAHACPPHHAVSDQAGPSELRKGFLADKRASGRAARLGEAALLLNPAKTWKQPLDAPLHCRNVRSSKSRQAADQCFGVGVTTNGDSLHLGATKKKATLVSALAPDADPTSLLSPGDRSILGSREVTVGGSLGGADPQKDRQGLEEELSVPPPPSRERSAGGWVNNWWCLETPKPRGLDSSQGDGYTHMGCALQLHGDKGSCALMDLPTASCITAFMINIKQAHSSKLPNLGTGWREHKLRPITCAGLCGEGSLRAGPQPVGLEVKGHPAMTAGAARPPNSTHWACGRNNRSAGQGPCRASELRNKLVLAHCQSPKIQASGTSQAEPTGPTTMAPPPPSPHGAAQGRSALSPAGQPAAFWMLNKGPRPARPMWGIWPAPSSRPSEPRPSLVFLQNWLLVFIPGTPPQPTRGTPLSAGCAPHSPCQLRGSTWGHLATSEALGVLPSSLEPWLSLASSPIFTRASKEERRDGYFPGKAVTGPWHQRPAGSHEAGPELFVVGVPSFPSTRCPLTSRAIQVKLQGAAPTTGSGRNVLMRHQPRARDLQSQGQGDSPASLGRGLCHCPRLQSETCTWEPRPNPTAPLALIRGKPDRAGLGPKLWACGFPGPGSGACCLLPAAELPSGCGHFETPGVPTHPFIRGAPSALRLKGSRSPSRAGLRGAPARSIITISNLFSPEPAPAAGAVCHPDGWAPWNRWRASQVGRGLAGLGRWRAAEGQCDVASGLCPISPGKQAGATAGSTHTQAGACASHPGTRACEPIPQPGPDGFTTRTSTLHGWERNYSARGGSTGRRAMSWDDAFQRGPGRPPTPISRAAAAPALPGPGARCALSEPPPSLRQVVFWEHLPFTSGPGAVHPRRQPPHAAGLTCQRLLVVLPHGDEVPEAGVELLHDAPGIRTVREESRRCYAQGGDHKAMVRPQSSPSCVLACTSAQRGRSRSRCIGPADDTSEHTPASWAAPSTQPGSDTLRGGAATLEEGPPQAAHKRLLRPGAPSHQDPHSTSPGRTQQAPSAHPTDSSLVPPPPALRPKELELPRVTGPDGRLPTSASEDTARTFKERPWPHPTSSVPPCDTCLVSPEDKGETAQAGKRPGPVGRLPQPQVLPHEHSGALALPAWPTGHLSASRTNAGSEKGYGVWAPENPILVFSIAHPASRMETQVQGAHCQGWATPLHAVQGTWEGNMPNNTPSLLDAARVRAPAGCCTGLRNTWGRSSHLVKVPSPRGQRPTPHTGRQNKTAGHGSLRDGEGGSQAESHRQGQTQGPAAGSAGVEHDARSRVKGGGSPWWGRPLSRAGRGSRESTQVRLLLGNISSSCPRGAQIVAKTTQPNLSDGEAEGRPRQCGAGGGRGGFRDTAVGNPSLNASNPRSTWEWGWRRRGVRGRRRGAVGRGPASGRSKAGGWPCPRNRRGSEPARAAGSLLPERQACMRMRPVRIRFLAAVTGTRLTPARVVYERSPSPWQKRRLHSSLPLAPNILMDSRKGTSRGPGQPGGHRGIRPRPPSDTRNSARFHFLRAALSSRTRNVQATWATRPSHIATASPAWRRRQTREGCGAGVPGRPSRPGQRATLAPSASRMLAPGRTAGFHRKAHSHPALACRSLISQKRSPSDEMGPRGPYPLHKELPCGRGSSGGRLPELESITVLGRTQRLLDPAGHAVPRPMKGPNPPSEALGGAQPPPTAGECPHPAGCPSRGLCSPSLHTQRTGTCGALGGDACTNRGRSPAQEGPGLRCPPHHGVFRGTLMGGSRHPTACAGREEAALSTFQEKGSVSRHQHQRSARLGGRPPCTDRAAAPRATGPCSRLLEAPARGHFPAAGTQTPQHGQRPAASTNSDLCSTGKTDTPPDAAVASTIVRGPSAMRAPCLLHRTRRGRVKEGGAQEWQAVALLLRCHRTGHPCHPSSPRASCPIHPGTPALGAEPSCTGSIGRTLGAASPDRGLPTWSTPGHPGGLHTNEDPGLQDTPISNLASQLERPPQLDCSACARGPLFTSWGSSLSLSSAPGDAPPPPAPSWQGCHRQRKKAGVSACIPRTRAPACMRLSHANKLRDETMLGPSLPHREGQPCTLITMNPHWTDCGGTKGIKSLPAGSWWSQSGFNCRLASWSSSPLPPRAAEASKRRLAPSGATFQQWYLATRGTGLVPDCPHLPPLRQEEQPPALGPATRVQRARRQRPPKGAYLLPAAAAPPPGAQHLRPWARNPHPEPGSLPSPAVLQDSRLVVGGERAGLGRRRLCTPLITWTSVLGTFWKKENQLQERQICSWLSLGWTHKDDNGFALYKVRGHRRFQNKQPVRWGGAHGKGPQRNRDRQVALNTDFTSTALGSTPHAPHGTPPGAMRPHKPQGPPTPNMHMGQGPAPQSMGRLRVMQPPVESAQKNVCNRTKQGPVLPWDSPSPSSEGQPCREPEERPGGQLRWPSYCSGGSCWPHSPAKGEEGVVAAKKPPCSKTVVLSLLPRVTPGSTLASYEEGPRGRFCARGSGRPQTTGWGRAFPAPCDEEGVAELPKLPTHSWGRAAPPSPGALDPCPTPQPSLGTWVLSGLRLEGDSKHQAGSVPLGEPPHRNWTNPARTGATRQGPNGPHQPGHFLPIQTHVLPTRHLPASVRARPHLARLLGPAPGHLPARCLLSGHSHEETTVCSWGSSRCRNRAPPPTAQQGSASPAWKHTGLCRPRRPSPLPLGCRVTGADSVPNSSTSEVTDWCPSEKRSVHRQAEDDPVRTRGEARTHPGRGLQRPCPTDTVKGAPAAWQPQEVAPRPIPTSLAQALPSLWLLPDQLEHSKATDTSLPLGRLRPSSRRPGSPQDGKHHEPAGTWPRDSGAALRPPPAARQDALAGHGPRGTREASAWASPPSPRTSCPLRDFPSSKLTTAVTTHPTCPTARKGSTGFSNGKTRAGLAPARAQPSTLTAGTCRPHAEGSPTRSDTQGPPQSGVRDKCGHTPPLNGAGPEQTIKGSSQLAIISRQQSPGGRGQCAPSPHRRATTRESMRPSGPRHRLQSLPSSAGARSPNTELLPWLGRLHRTTC